jgi:hypothetical protein
VAAISFKPVKFDLAGNADRLEKAFRSARQNARIAVAPEGVLEGYVVNEIIAGKPRPRHEGRRGDVDDPVIRRFQVLARELEMPRLWFRGAHQGGGLQLRRVHRSIGTHPRQTPQDATCRGSHPDWWFNRLGAESRADTPFGRCGIVICNERWNPQLPRILALDGARFLVIPSYGTSGNPRTRPCSPARLSGVPIVGSQRGVTLVVNEAESPPWIETWTASPSGEITIPAPIAAQPEERDRTGGNSCNGAKRIARYEKTMEKAKAEVPAESAGEKRGGPRQPGGLFQCSGYEQGRRPRVCGDRERPGFPAEARHQRRWPFPSAKFSRNRSLPPAQPKAQRGPLQRPGYEQRHQS